MSLSTPDMQEALAWAAGEWGVALAPETGEALDLLLDEVLRWNARLRLVGHRDRAKALVDLILDALALVPLVRGDTLLDIGSGAGFPGLVLALALPKVAVTLLEGRAKKVSFQKQAVRLLDLGRRVNPLVGRAGEGAYQRGEFGTVTLRAVSGLGASLGLGRPQAIPGGRVLLPRGREDLAAATDLGLATRLYRLPPPFGERLLVWEDQPACRAWA
ncbi:MAG: class I SAM-dependent methyltransferase [Deltaproteobacteria bacterium]|nr:class I SAM-dependent methyltransferase [Deltaproteobacteria bacterium]